MRLKVPTESIFRWAYIDTNYTSIWFLYFYLLNYGNVATGPFEYHYKPAARNHFIFYTQLHWGFLIFVGDIFSSSFFFSDRTRCLIIRRGPLTPAIFLCATRGRKPHVTMVSTRIKLYAFDFTHCSLVIGRTRRIILCERSQSAQGVFDLKTVAAAWLCEGKK